MTICSRSDEGDGLGAMADQIRKFDQRALTIKTDVSRSVDVENMVKKTVAELGDIDILINNAGIFVQRSLLETDEGTCDKVIDINLKGCYLCSRAVGQLMLKRKRGIIINIASTYAI